MATTQCLGVIVLESITDLGDENLSRYEPNGPTVGGGWRGYKQKGQLIKLAQDKERTKVPENSLILWIVFTELTHMAAEVLHGSSAMGDTA